MTDSEKLTMLKSMTGETNEEVLSTYLRVAESIVLRRAYPYQESVEFPAKYDVVQVEIAAYKWGKRGAEGETSHSENGISRSYDDADVPSSLLRRIVPVAGVIFT